MTGRIAPHISYSFKRTLKENTLFNSIMMNNLIAQEKSRITAWHFSLKCKYLIFGGEGIILTNPFEIAAREKDKGTLS